MYSSSSQVRQKWVVAILFSSVNDTIELYLPAFSLSAKLFPWPESISDDLDRFLAENRDIADLFPFASLKIIEFELLQCWR